LDWDIFLKKAKDAGYDGIEYGISKEDTEDELKRIMDKIQDHGLEFIPQHFDTCADFEKYYANYKSWMEKLKPLQFLKVNSQTGKDHFSFNQNSKLIDLATEFAKENNIQILHETHRGKFSFAAHITKKYLSVLPHLKITLDASHWVNVSESYLEDQPEAMDLAILRTEHVHARIGFPEGPQVNDPRAPEWQMAMYTHLAWLDKIAKRKQEENALLTITPELVLSLICLLCLLQTVCSQPMGY
jgi:sugar phosphate isomerase/epimerase